MEHKRACIRLDSQTDIVKMTQILSHYPEKFAVENFDGKLRVNAKSLLGVCYATSEFGQLFLVNDDGGEVPSAIDQWRA